MTSQLENELSCMKHCWGVYEENNIVNQCRCWSATDPGFPGDIKQPCMKIKKLGPSGGARPKFYYVDPPLLMIWQPNLLDTSMFHLQYFSSNFSPNFESFLETFLWGHWYSCFWTSGDVYPGFQSQWWIPRLPCFVTCVQWIPQIHL